MTGSKRLLLVAATTGYQTQMFAEAARMLGIELVLATDRCHVLEDPWGDHAIAIRFDDPHAAVATVAGGTHVDGILALGDRPAIVAAAIAEQLGLRFHPPCAVAACRNKFLARERFRAANLPVPGFFRVPLNSDPSTAAGRASYPCVLKPLGLSASRGVIRANNTAEFVVAFRRIEALLNTPEILRTREEQDEYIQIECFIPGAEFALEGIVVDGKLETLALFDKPDRLDGPFFEETIYVTPSRSEPKNQADIQRTAEIAVQALGLTNGPIHAEMRVNSEGVWMLEVAARPIGGLCARVLPTLPEILLRHAVGDDIGKLPRTSKPAGVLMIPILRAGVYQSVAGVEDALRRPLIEDVIITAKQGQTLIPLPEGNSYLGFVFARGESAERVEAALRAAQGALRFEITTALPVCY